MRFFSHMIAEYTCSKHCGYHRSVIGANISLFHRLAALAATLPLWGFSLREEFPWYYFISILAGELILVFLAGFISGLLLMPFTLRGTTKCRNRNAVVFLAGRHFDPVGSAKPHWSDFAVFIAYIGLNVMVWVARATGKVWI